MQKSEESKEMQKTLDDIKNDLMKYKGYTCMYSWHNFTKLDNNTFVPKVGCRKQPEKDIPYQDCEHCPMYKNGFIQYPITVNKMTGKAIDYNSILYASYVGKPAIVRLAGENETYQGIFIGELPYSVNPKYKGDEQSVYIEEMMNPAIFVPELKRIVFGCESWWKVIENEEDLKKEITDEMIKNTWYVQMAQEMCRKDHDE